MVPAATRTHAGPRPLLRVQFHLSPYHLLIPLSGSGRCRDWLIAQDVRACRSLHQVHLWTQVHPHRNTLTCMLTQTRTNLTHPHTYAHTHTCSHTHMLTHMCSHSCKFTHPRTCTHTLTPIRSHTCTHTFMQSHMLTHIHSHMLTHSRTLTNMHSCTHPYALTPTTVIRLYAHTCSYTHTSTLACPHTHAHIHAHPGHTHAHTAERAQNSRLPRSQACLHPGLRFLPAGSAAQRSPVVSQAGGARGRDVLLGRWPLPSRCSRPTASLSLEGSPVDLRLAGQLEAVFLGLGGLEDHIKL